MSNPAARDTFLHEVRTRLAEDGSGEPALLAVLDRVLRRFDCTTGTVHTSTRPPASLCYGRSAGSRRRS